MAHRPRRLLVVALPMLLAAACGGSGHTDNPNKPSRNPGPTALPTATRTTPGASSSAGSSTAPSTGSGTATGSPGSSAKPSSRATGAPFTVTLKLAKTCVTPGGTQRADITALPGATVVIDTVYADKKEGTVHGGLGHGTANAAGKYSYSWKVLPGTPPGPAVTVVKAGKGDRRGQTYQKFRVALTC